MSGEIVIEVQFRVPADSLQPADVERAAAQIEAALVAAGLTPHSVSGFAVTGDYPGRSLGFQFLKLLGEMQ